MTANRENASRESSMKEMLDRVATGLEEAKLDIYTRDYYLLRQRMKTLLPRLRPRRVLELGTAEGTVTWYLARNAEAVVSVDGSPLLLERARKEVPEKNVVFVEALFEAYEPEGKFSSIVLSCILEHVDDPVAILARAGRWLEPDGLIHIVVPNAGALNRRVGRAMGMLANLDQLHEGDQRLGHQRVYSWKKMGADIEAAGLVASHLDGILLKPLSDAQMKDWDTRIVDALYEVGKDFPELCSEIYAECRLPAEK
jgi:SAM-dependent methyltransferase